jgi:hypothetical protein
VIANGIFLLLAFLPLLVACVRTTCIPRFKGERITHAYVIPAGASSGAVDPKPSWWTSLQRIYVRDRLKRARIYDLADVRLGETTTEVRIWSGFARCGTVGVIIRHQDGEYRAVGLPYETAGRATESADAIELFPKRPWLDVWGDVMTSGILQLPQQRPEDTAPVADGTMYVVEVASGGKYRAYLYASPDQTGEAAMSADDSEISPLPATRPSAEGIANAKRLLKAVEMLRHEFDISRF